MNDQASLTEAAIATARAEQRLKAHAVIVREFYANLVPLAVSGLAARLGINAADVERVLASPDALAGEEGLNRLSDFLLAISGVEAEFTIIPRAALEQEK